MSTEIVIAIFPSRQLLTEALDHIIHLGDLGIRRSAIVAKAANGETLIIGDDISANEGGIAGGLLGAVLMALGLVQLGALTLPVWGVLLVLAVGLCIGGLLGAFIGRITANMIDQGFSSGQLNAYPMRLQLGRPALVVEIVREPDLLTRLHQELRLFQAEFVQQRGAAG